MLFQLFFSYTGYMNCSSYLYEKSTDAFTEVRKTKGIHRKCLFFHHLNVNSNGNKSEQGALSKKEIQLNLCSIFSSLIFSEPYSPNGSQSRKTRARKTLVWNKIILPV